MSLNKLAKRLRREVTANPKKAAVLGLLVAVALWFWAPLVWSWISPEDAVAETTAAAPAVDPLPASPTGIPVRPDTTTKSVESPQYPWQELVKWMASDPRTSPANIVLDRRDPFVTPKSRVVEPDPEPEPKDESQEAQADITPQSLGMVLSSTIIGPRRRVARIGGKSYQPGDTVIGSKDGQQIEFTLAEVYARRIILNRGGKRFELKIPFPAHTGRVDASAGKPAS